MKKRDHLKKLFEKDLYWKALSVVLATFLWFVVMNVINPTETKNFVTEVELTNLQALSDEGYTVLNAEEISNLKIDIKIKGTRPALDDLRKNNTVSNITAVVDLSSVSVHPDSTMPQNFAVKVTPKLTESFVYTYDIVSYSPSSINVTVDKLVSSNRNLSVKTTGKPALNFVADDPECDVTTVRVKGPSTMVGDISSVQAVVDVTGKNANVSQSAEVVVLDSEGKQLSGFEVEPSYVSVNVNIRKEGTVKINQPQTEGSLPDGLELDSIDWYPKSVDVKGKASAVERTSSVNLPVIDLSSVSSSATYTYSVKKLLEDTGLTSDVSNVTVSVKVSAQDDDGELVPVVIKSSEVNMTSADQKLKYKLENVEVVLNGNSEEMEAITVESLNPTVNVAGLSKGKHKVTVNLTLPQGVIATKNTADITIYDDEDAPSKSDDGNSSENVTETTTAYVEETTSETTVAAEEITTVSGE
jgi:YbbR domain-containing protein